MQECLAKIKILFLGITYLQEKCSSDIHNSIMLANIFGKYLMKNRVMES